MGHPELLYNKFGLLFNQSVFQNLLQVRLGPLGTVSVRVFTGRMPFLSPNKQCQSTEGTYGSFRSRHTV